MLNSYIAINELAYEKASKFNICYNCGLNYRIFSVVNVDMVTVNFLFGKAEWPLILVIIGSVLLGALLAGLISMMNIYQLQRTLKK